MSTKLTLTRGTTLQTLISTAAALNSTVAALGSAITLTDAGYPFADVLVNATCGTTPTANTGLSCWLLRDDGAGNYEDGGTSLTPARRADFTVPLELTTAAQAIIIPDVKLPPGAFKLLVLNNTTGATLTSGWTVKGYCSTFSQG